MANETPTSRFEVGNRPEDQQTRLALDQAAAHLVAGDTIEIVSSTQGRTVKVKAVRLARRRYAVVAQFRGWEPDWRAWSIEVRPGSEPLRSALIWPLEVLAFEDI